jgi:hypothetical protein
MKLINKEMKINFITYIIFAIILLFIKNIAALIVVTYIYAMFYPLWLYHNR